MSQDGLKKSSVDAPPPPNGPRGSATVVPTSTAKSSAAPPSSTPSGPRAQLSSGTEITNGSSLPKSPFDTSVLCFAIVFRLPAHVHSSIPRPQRIKRTDRDSPKPLVETKSGQPPSGPAADRKYNLSKEDNTRPSSPLSGNNFQEKGKGHANGDDTRSPVAPPMPPPSVPSQTMSAQELRETAKQTMHRNDHRSDDSAPAAPTATNRSKSPVSPRIRSPSPSSRPGTRNASSDSRASGGKAKSTKDSRQDSREVPTRRDSLTHSRGNDRSRREGEKDERDRDRGRDRHGDRDGHRDHRGDHRDRDRHRRDEKERKDRGQPAPTGPLEDRRTDPRRVDEGPAHLGKRRRPGDDEVRFCPLLSRMSCLVYHRYSLTVVPNARHGKILTGRIARGEAQKKRLVNAHENVEKEIERKHRKRLLVSSALYDDTDLAVRVEQNCLLVCHLVREL